MTDSYFVDISIIRSKHQAVWYLWASPCGGTAHRVGTFPEDPRRPTSLDL